MANAALAMIFKFQGEKEKGEKEKKNVAIKYHGHIIWQRVNPDNTENYR